MKYIKNKKYLIILIIVLGFALRIYRISDVPVHLTQDEASLGYNAYSILKTGRDEYGKLLPIIFKSFGDYKPGFYVYLTALSVAVFGLNEFAVRLPSVLAGTLSIYLVYLIGRRLVDDKVGLIAAFVLALNPWSVFISRGAWEANVSLTLTLLGVWAFYNAFNNNKYLTLSATCFGMSLITYQGAKMSSLIVILLLGLIYWKDFKKIKPEMIMVSGIIGALLAMPAVVGLLIGQGGRLKVFSIFSYPRSEEYINDFIAESGVLRGSPLYYLFYSEALNFLRGIIGRWFNHFSYRFLFGEGEWLNAGHAIPGMGQMLFVNLFSLVVGFFVMIKEKITREKLFIVLWLIFVPLSAALSRDQVNSVRSLNMTVPLTLIVGMGIRFVNINFSKLKWIFGTVYLLSFIYFVDAYFVHMPVHNARSWNYGYKQMTEYVSDELDNYDKVYIQQSYAQPYIYYLFYTKYPPVKYQIQAKLAQTENANDVGFVEKIDNIAFTEIHPPDYMGTNSLVVSNEISFGNEKIDPNFFEIVKKIYNTDGGEVFRIIKAYEN